MEISVEQALRGYAEAYQKLYNRQPKDLRAIDNNLVIVNGARIRVEELEFLTRQLQQEYKQSLPQRKGMISKLIGWLSKQ